MRRHLSAFCLCIAAAASASAEIYSFPNGPGNPVFVPRSAGKGCDIDGVGINDLGESVLFVSRGGTAWQRIVPVGKRHRPQGATPGDWLRDDFDVLDVRGRTDAICRYSQHVWISGQQTIRQDMDFLSFRGTSFAVWEWGSIYNVNFPDHYETWYFPGDFAIPPNGAPIVFGPWGWTDIEAHATYSGFDIHAPRKLGFDVDESTVFALHVHGSELRRTEPLAGALSTTVIGAVATYPARSVVAARRLAGRHDALLYADGSLFAWNSESGVETEIGNENTAVAAEAFAGAASKFPVLDDAGWLHVVLSGDRIASCSPDGAWTIHHVDLGERSHFSPSSLAEPLLATAWKSEDETVTGIDLGVFRDGAWQFQTVCAWADAAFDIERVHVRALPNGAPAIIYLRSDGRAYRTDAKPDAAAASAGGRQR